MELTQDTRAFITDLFDSVESVEIVLLLRRSPNAFWTPQAVSGVLGIREDLAAKKLAALCAAKLLKRGETSGAYRYAPNDDGQAKRVDALADAYADQRVNVLNFIYSANLERLRAFSDAFKLKKP